MSTVDDLRSRGIQGFCPVDDTGKAMGDENSLPVAITNFEGGTIELTGDILVDSWGSEEDAKELDPDAETATMPSLMRGQLARLGTLGAVDDTPETDPDAALATIPALLRGALTHLDTLITVVGDASDEAGASTVIGLLKQIAENTVPPDDNP